MIDDIEFVMMGCVVRLNQGRLHSTPDISSACSGTGFASIPPRSWTRCAFGSDVGGGASAGDAQAHYRTVWST